MLTWGRKPGGPLRSGCLEELVVDGAAMLVVMVVVVAGDDDGNGVVGLSRVRRDSPGDIELIGALSGLSCDYTGWR